MSRTIVVNALGGPGSGKSTLAYGLIALLKARHHKAEYVAEFAKELTYRRDWAWLSNSDAVVREQDRRLRDVVGHVDFVVHDSSLLLGLIYAQGEYQQGWFQRRVWELYDGYRNYNVFVRRTKPYQQYGRTQTEEESRALDQKILDLFGHRIDLYLDGDEEAAEKAYAALMQIPQ